MSFSCRFFIEPGQQVRLGQPIGCVQDVECVKNGCIDCIDTVAPLPPPTLIETPTPTLIPTPTPTLAVTPTPTSVPTPTEAIEPEPIIVGATDEAVSKSKETVVVSR